MSSISAPTGAPRDVVPSTTSRNISVSWDTIECIERNGEITDYTVEFQEQGGAAIPGEVNVMDRTFIATGLRPFTRYVFRVAGVNNVDIGPFTDGIIFRTDEDRMLQQLNLYICIDLLHITLAPTILLP